MIEQTKRYAARDAPSESEFERLLKAAYESTDFQRVLEDRFIVVTAGRLTLRRAELLHFNRDWLDPDRKLIRIPHHEDCVCTYCIERAEEYADGKDMTVEEALEFCWSPKTQAGVRAIYYGWSPRTIAAVEDFADIVGELDMDVSTVNRRVNTLGDRAGFENIYPHALRAASAFYWADRGLEAAYLQALMGWNSIEVAVSYLSASGRQLAQRIERAFALEGLSRPDAVPAEDLIPPSEEAIETTPDHVTRDPKALPLTEFTSDSETEAASSG